MSEKDFKDTLNLPNTKFPMRGDLVKREPARIEHWKKSDLYGLHSEKERGTPQIVLHDGPRSRTATSTSAQRSTKF